MSTPSQLVIFDLDGTLIDSKLDLAHSVNATRAHLQLRPLPHELIYSYVGNGAPVLIRRALPELPEQEVPAALQYFLDYYREHKLDFTKLYPNVRETISELAEDRIRLAVLTNKPVNISRAILEELQLASAFFRIYGGNSFEQKKPHPMGVESLLEESGISGDRTLMVGDSSVDILTARNSGVRCVGCTWGFQPESLITHPPDWIIEDMGELPDIVRGVAALRPKVII